MERLYVADRAGSNREAHRPGPLLALTTRMEELRPDVAYHGRMVAGHTALLAAELGIDGEPSRRLQLAAELHDIGKITVPKRVLDKPGRLDDGEWELVRLHTTTGARMLRRAGLPEIAAWVLAHHERPDGRGYPRGLRGSEIPFEVAILAVADAYDAMTSDRPYRAALSHEQALDELSRGATKQFEAEPVEAFLGSIRRLIGGGNPSRPPET